MMTITLHTEDTEHTFTGYAVRLTIETGYGVRRGSFTTWNAVLEWLKIEAERRQDPAGRDLWNFRIVVR